MSRKLRIVGIDPSLTSTGIATHDKGTYVVRFGQRPTSATEDGWMHRRVLVLRAEIVRACAFADVVFIENFAFGAQQGREKLGYVGHSIRETLGTLGVPHVDIPPKTLKLFATGNGSAEKEEVKRAAVDFLGLDPSAKDDEADALWLRELGRHLYGVSSRMPPTSHTDHLKKIEIPEIER